MSAAKDGTVRLLNVHKALAAPRRRPVGTLLARLVHVLALQLPHGEASDVDVELVQAGDAIGVSGELNLELHLILGHGLVTHGARGPDAGAAPRAIRAPGGQLAVYDRISGFLAED